jgi:hypothetical protein
MREGRTVKAEEVKRYLEYLGYETQDLNPVVSVSRVSRKRFALLAVVLCGLILVGMAAYATRPHKSSVALAQVADSISDDLDPTGDPLSTNDLSDAGENMDPLVCWGYQRQNFSYKCVGPYYPILVGLLACHGE